MHFLNLKKIVNTKVDFMSVPKIASSCLSVRMEQLGSHWMDIHEILYFRILRKSFLRIQVSLKSDKNKGYFT